MFRADAQSWYHAISPGCAYVHQGAALAGVCKDLMRAEDPLRNSDSLRSTVPEAAILQSGTIYPAAYAARSASTSSHQMCLQV
jgi:hypothetical protein